MASKAQIVATLGPVSRSQEIIKKMSLHGLDVVRLNFSWGTLEEHAEYIFNTRSVATELGRNIPIIQDLPGPRVQEGNGHGVDPNSPVLTDHDKKLLEFGVEQKVDYIALSFVGKSDDILDCRAYLKSIGSDLPIIAKIERREAIENFDEILEEADAIMVARGDLGEAFPIEELPFIQADLIARSKSAGKSVITATQMLLSMTEKNEPTRAEVTDVANAILQGSDAVMLSEETAIGKYPIEAVSVMEKIVAKSEKYSHFVEELHLLQ